MKVISRYLILIAAIFALSAANADAQSFSRGNTPNGNIEQQVFKKILTLPYYGVFDHIAFKVDNGGVVTLYGKVVSLGTRRNAERVVQRIPGVRQVINNIDELPPSSFDNTIRRRIVREFANSAGIYGYLREPNPSVRIIVENGHVTLEGFVDNRGTSNLMNVLTNSVPGVFSVRNNLMIGKQSPR